MKTWNLNIDGTPGAVQAVLADLRIPNPGVGAGNYYDSMISYSGDQGTPPSHLVQIKNEFENRGYRTDLS